MTELLPLRVAAERIGVRGDAALRRFRRTLIAVERNAGKPVLVRAGGRGRQARLLVTMRALRRAVPQMFEDAIDREARKHRDAIVEAMHDRFGRIDDEIGDLHGRTNLLASEIGRVKRRVSAIDHATQPRGSKPSETIRNHASR